MMKVVGDKERLALEDLAIGGLGLREHFSLWQPARNRMRWNFADTHTR